MLTPQNTAYIAAEYTVLCAALGITPVTLDVFEVDDDPTSTSLSQHGNRLSDGNARYSASKKVLVLPLCDGDPKPTGPVSFPPSGLSKWSAEWPSWRIDLWHEVVHQVADHLGVHNPHEPGRPRADGSKSDEGHGAGFWQAMQSVAGAFFYLPADLDSLLDR